ncbi:hypothetical protein ONZ45_g16830 [Pleurotus djamor]|nr:hypothetical protein ONZ45_g16830 [Pleurotus djamor]
MMIDCFLFGITLSQTVVYFRQYPNDKAILRYLVWFSLIVDTFHMVMVAEVVHFWYIYCRLPERYEGLPSFHWALGASIIGTYLITSAVQCLYILRVSALNGAKAVIIALSALSILQLVFGFVLWGDLTVAKSLAAVHETMGQIGGSIELAATTVCDIGISVSLWYYLHRGRSGFARTENVVNKLILYTVNIGFLTSCASSLTLILWLTLPENFIFITFTLIRSKLYVNSMLVTLNFRKTARKALRSTNTFTGAASVSKFYQDLDIDDKEIELDTMASGSTGRTESTDINRDADQDRKADLIVP